VLEDTKIKLANVVADRCGVSGRQRRAAFITGERAPQALAALARGRLRQKLPELALALAGQCTTPHAQLITLGLARIAVLTRQSAARDQPIGVLVAPLTPQMEQLASLPGVEATATRQILAEIGTDRRRFGSDARLASWAMGVSRQRRKGRQAAPRPDG
jgi:transposase